MPSNSVLFPVLNDWLAEVLHGFDLAQPGAERSTKEIVQL